MTHTQHLANAIIIFIGSLLAAALIIAALNGPFESIMSSAGVVSESTEAATGHGFITQAWGLAPLIVVFLGLVQLVGAAARESSV